VKETRVGLKRALIQLWNSNVVLVHIDSQLLNGDSVWKERGTLGGETVVWDAPVCGGRGEC
jgi:hypothetical protein